MGEEEIFSCRRGVLQLQGCRVASTRRFGGKSGGWVGGRPKSQVSGAMLPAVQAPGHTSFIESGVSSGQRRLTGMEKRLKCWAAAKAEPVRGSATGVVGGQLQYLDTNRLGLFIRHIVLVTVDIRPIIAIVFAQLRSRWQKSICHLRHFGLCKASKHISPP